MTFTDYLSSEALRYILSTYKNVIKLLPGLHAVLILWTFPGVLIGWHEGHLACKESAVYPQMFSSRTVEGELKVEPASPGSPEKWSLKWMLWWWWLIFWTVLLCLSACVDFCSILDSLLKIFRSVRPYVRPSDFNLICCVGRSWPDMRASVT